MMRLEFRALLSIPTIFAMVGVLASFALGCSAVEPISDSEASQETYLELDVEPTSARIYIDGDYRGTVDGWQQQVVPVEPGYHRLELRADGFVTQRFDVDIERGQWIILTARLQSDIDTPDGEALENDERDELTPPDHPASSDE